MPGNQWELKGWGSHIRIVGERVQGQLVQELRMLDVLQVMLPERAVGIPVLKQKMRPVGSVGILEDQEGLPADGTASSNTWALRSIEPDRSLELGEAGAMFERLLPSRSMTDSRSCKCSDRGLRS